MDMIAPVGSAAATRPLQPFGGGALTPGHVVHARVAKVDGDMVQLRLGDQTVAVATKVPLTVGQQVNLMVEEGTAGKLLLRLVEDVFSGTLRQARPEAPGTARGSTTTTTGTAPAPGRELPVTGVQGRAERDTSGSSHGQSFEGGEQDWSGTGLRLGVNGAQARLAGLGTPELGPRISGPAGQGLPNSGQGLPSPSQTPGTLGQAPGSSGHLFGAPGQPPAAPGQAAGAPGQAPGMPGQPSGAPGQTFSALNPNLNGLWLAGANAATRLGQPARPGTPGAGENGTGSTGTTPAQPGPANQASAARGGLPASGATGTQGAGASQTIGSWTQLADTWVQGTGALPQGTGPRTPGQPTRNPSASESDPLATVLFEKLDGSATRLAGSARTRTSDLLSGAAAPRYGASGRPTAQPTPPGHEHVARAAMPAYGRLAQSVGGSVAFGQLMAALPREVGETFARAPLAPADLGRLLIDVGVHPDEMNAVLVGELLAQKVPVQEATVRSLRRELAAAGGAPGDAAPAVALARLGLPITPLSLAVARQMLAGQLDPPAAWSELLPALQRVARFAGRGSQAGMLAAELMSDWQVPVSDGPEAVAQWLRTTLDQTGTPLEAKLARAFLANGDSSASATPGQDVRARLDLLAQALPPVARPDRDSLGQSLLRLQATVQAEQLLNASSAERAEPRYFAVTLPTVLHQQPGTLQIRVREREARPRAPGEIGRPDLVHLKLSLPGLGELGVNLTVGQNSVACHFAAGSAFAESLLTASSRELVGRLKQLGYAHTAVDATHEPPEVIQAPLVAAPRVSHVDVQA